MILDELKARLVAVKCEKERHRNKETYKGPDVGEEAKAICPAFPVKEKRQRSRCREPGYQRENMQFAECQLIHLGEPSIPDRQIDNAYRNQPGDHQQCVVLHKTCLEAAQHNRARSYEPSLQIDK